MTDVYLIYSALLRAERRVEDTIAMAPYGDRAIARYEAGATMDALRLLREEIGNGLAERGAAGPVRDEP